MVRAEIWQAAPPYNRATPHSKSNTYRRGARTKHTRRTQKAQLARETWICKPADLQNHLRNHERAKINTKTFICKQRRAFQNATSTSTTGVRHKQQQQQQQARNSSAKTSNAKLNCDGACTKRLRIHPREERPRENQTSIDAA